MTIVEKAAYLKGLTEGLGITPDSKEGKLWGALNELLSDMAHEIEDLQARNLDFAEALDDISEDLTYLEELTCDLDMPEDMLDEDDWEGWAKAHAAITRTYLIADDFTVSNKARITRAVENGCIDGFILKPNQVGIISEALDAHYYAQAHGLFSITSGRSGGVVGDVVMDMAVGLQIPFIKNGCPRSGERIDKLNFLMRVKDSYPGCHMAKIDDIVRF